MPPTNNLILLHGALGSGAQCQSLAQTLSAQFQVHPITFSGHGGLPIAQPFSLQQMALDVLQYVDEQQIDQPKVLGYSMGGYVATYIALHHPNRFSHITTLGTKWDWTPETADKETRMLNPDVIQEKVPQFALMLEQRHHPEDWRSVLEYTAEFMYKLAHGMALQKSDFEKITTPMLILRGDQDNMVTEAESKLVAHWLPKGTYQTLPDTPHPIEKVDYGMLMEALLTR